MAYKQSKHLFQGMSKDLSDDKQKGIYYIDAHNIRITAREDTTLLSVTNEKGNITLKVTQEDNNPFILGQYVGHAVLNNYLVLFTVRNDISNIWRLDLTKPDEVKSKLLYSGDLGFSEDNPIETLVDYETEEVQKVYWTDGDKQPRVINIVSDNIKPNVDTQFDFVPEVFPNNRDNLSVNIQKLINSSGSFKAGTIQYFVSYYNKFGQESNIVWQSPLLYISPEDRGGNVSETVGNVFQLNISGAPATFDFIRIYSVQHTSEDTDLLGRRIIDLSIPNNWDEPLVVIDNGVIGESINPSDLYYKGGVPTIIGTMAAKDQTLFLGNIRLQHNQRIPDSIKAEIHSLNIEFSSEIAYQAENVEGKLYEYYNQLNEEGQTEYLHRIHTIDPFIPISHSIASYKYLEKYRFGLQFQDVYGKWSEPVWIEDFQNNVAPEISIYNNTSYVRLPVAHLNYTLSQNTIQELKGLNYVNVRPLVVLPSFSDRECVAQGVVCPTVYNLGDRTTNSPYAQPSWFFRPFEGTNSINSVGMSLPYKHNAIIKGKISGQAEIEKAPEIQIPPTEDSTDYDQTHPEYGLPGIENTIYANKPIDNNNFFIDQSIITLNSPDIEFGDNIESGDYGFRIVGMIDVTGFSGSLQLQATAPNTFFRTVDYRSGNVGYGSPTAQNLAEGYLPTLVQQTNISASGWGIMGNGGFWLDTPYTEWKTYDTFSSSSSSLYLAPSGLRYYFTIFPWQAAGSLNSITGSRPFLDNIIAVSNINWPTTLTSDIQYKTLANLRYSAHTKYLTEDISNLLYDTSDTQIIDPQITTTTNLNGPSGKRVYYSNVDKLLTPPKNTVEDMLSKVTAAASDYAIYNNKDFKKIYDWDIIAEFKNVSSYPGTNLEVSGSPKFTIRQDMAYSFSNGGGLHVYAGATSVTNIIKDNARLSVKTTATHITYKSMKHAIISLSDYDASTYTVLPRIKFSSGGNERVVNNLYEGTESCWNYGIGPYNEETQLYDQIGPNYVWDKARTYNNRAAQKSVTIDDSEWYDKGVLLLGEIYRKEIPNKFGGTSDDAIQQNIWIPAGESTTIDNLENITWKVGDTYFQRYDCLKTYPYSNESMNNIVEILSFMCETRINIAGRYDKNRGLIDNTFITNENFNLVNKGYTQKDNFFSYRILDSRFGLRSFKTQLTWTKVKSAGALIDNWTNITLANTLDLDGDKGELVSLNRYKNDIIAFQPKGVSQIIYNPNVQINTESGLPIEIANSGKVQGKRYLYEGIGCQNKWSICDEVYGSLYFIDNLAKGIYKLSDQGLVSLTDTKGFRAWMESTNTLDLWKPYSNNISTRRRAGNFRTFYDKTYKDVYFVNGETCLVYSDLLDQFVSFMDYQGTNGMMNIGDGFYAISPLFNGSIWKQFAGEYNSIYNNYRTYNITFIDNAIPEMNKIYTNLEYRSDTYINKQLESDQTFDTIRVYNEYQDTGKHLISTVLDKPYLSDLQKKFRVWRIQLPRDKDNPLNRINNTWTKITLGKTEVKNEKTVLHDAIVGYYI